MSTRQARRILDLSTHTQGYVTVPALAAYLETDPRTLIRMIADGDLPAVKVRREWRIATDAACEAFHVQRHRAAS